MAVAMKYVGDGAIKKLLERHGCPTPFHVVRMRFLGEIASPALGISPTKSIESFWPNGMPEFDSQAEVEKLYGGLMGLWNHLARHQGGVPVKLHEMSKLRTWEDLAGGLRMRHEEVDAFVDGLAVTGMEAMVSAPLMKAISNLQRLADLLSEAEAAIADSAQETKGASLPDGENALRDHSASIEKMLSAVVMVSADLRRDMVAKPKRLH